jgi:hypothetical protein
VDGYNGNCSLRGRGGTSNVGDGRSGNLGCDHIGRSIDSIDRSRKCITQIAQVIVTDLAAVTALPYFDRLIAVVTVALSGERTLFAHVSLRAYDTFEVFLGHKMGARVKRRYGKRLRQDVTKIIFGDMSKYRAIMGICLPK